MDYVNVIYDQPLNEFLPIRTESVQYKAALAITLATQGSHREKVYQELSLESLHQRWCMRRLCSFWQVFHKKVPKYIHSLIPFIRTSTRQRNTFTSFYCRNEYFQNFILPCVISEWNEIDLDKRTYLSHNSFRKALLNFIRPSKNKIYNIHDQVDIKLRTRLGLGFSHLFQNNLEDTLNPLCSCSIETETTLHFAFMNDLINIDRSLHNKTNRKVLICTFQFIKDSH